MMELIRGLHNLKPHHRGCAVTIGNFDGVHIGHQAVVRQLAAKAAQLRLPTTVMLFEPQPLEFFRPDGAPARLMRLREKLQALAACGVERVLCVRFDAGFAALTAEEFIQRILIDGLGARYLVVGDDFRFGAGRRGDFDMLADAGRRHGFEVAATHTIIFNGVRISSTRIRECLAAGDFEMAQQLLGRPYAISGRIVHGDKLGRTLGVPTLNIPLRRKVSPLAGVFVVEVSGLRRERLSGVASVGTRPTVGGSRMLLEVHVFDFEADVYGRRVSVDFLHKLREERHFGSLEALRAAMAHDIAQARAFFAK
jgi:riboflavin kinase/FMN adenylyltransferase